MSYDHTHMLSHNILRATSKIAELIQEPAFASTIGVEDSTITETYTFTRIPGDADSVIHLDRTVGLTADDAVMSSSVWAVRELPVITGVTTDQVGDDALAEGTTRITLAGSYFAADPGDVKVFAEIGAKKYRGTHPLPSGRQMVEATIVSTDDLDDDAGGAEIVCDLTLSRFSNRAELREPLIGSQVFIYVQNNKRLLRSDFDSSMVLI